MLKNTFYLLIIAILLGACGSNGSDSDKLPSDLVNNPNSATGTSEDGVAKIVFDKDSHDFGKIIQGEKVTYAFKFKNKGTGNLIISDVSSSCGCTIPKYTKDPIGPGKSGVLQVTFESDNRKGFQNKTVTVVSNTQPNSKVLKIKAQIIIPEKEY